VTHSLFISFIVCLFICLLFIYLFYLFIYLFFLSETTEEDIKQSSLNITMTPKQAQENASKQAAAEPTPRASSMLKRGEQNTQTRKHTQITHTNTQTRTNKQTTRKQANTYR
jgi:hypothetical protein